MAITRAFVVLGIVAGCAANDDGTVHLAGTLPVADLAISPLPLTPAFAPGITDYYLRCASGTNALDVAVTDSDGTQHASVSVVEDQAIDVRGQYFVRCLPADFSVLTVTTTGAGPTPGWYLLNSTGYAMVLDTHGTPVWYARGTYPVNVDSPAPDTLSFLTGGGASFGTDPAARFQRLSLATLERATTAAVGSPTDPHELYPLANGNFLLFTYPLVDGIDLTGLASFGAIETIADCEVQEIDPAGALVWSWRASEHLDPVRDSVEPIVTDVDGTSVVDVFHFNSIDVDATGNLLLSARHTNAVYYVERATGDIAWKLVDTFSMQHDARFLPNGDISLFDDHGAGGGVARGLEYAVERSTGAGRVVFEYRGAAPSGYMGSFRRYADGHSVIGWGHNNVAPTALTEIDAAGAPVLEVAFANDSSYRAIKVPLAQLDLDLLRSATAK